MVYENGHGLQELARHQKKMKEDQRRLEMMIENMADQCSDLTEAKDLVEQSFLKLKEETGVCRGSRAVSGTVLDVTGTVLYHRERY